MSSTSSSAADSPWGSLPEPRVVWADNHLLAVDKPPGWPTQGDPSGDPSLVDWAKDYLKRTYHKPGEVYLGLLHRLDRPVGGLVLLARTSKAAARMSRQFQARQVQKRYLAICQGRPRDTQGELTHHLSRLPGKNIVRCRAKPGPDTQEARLRFRRLHSAANHSLLEIELLTGRRHQIRAQLDSIGCSIVGDLKYRYPHPLPDKSLALLAWRLGFEHPVRKAPIALQAPWPQRLPWRPSPTPDQLPHLVQQASSVDWQAFAPDLA